MENNNEKKYYLKEDKEVVLNRFYNLPSIETLKDFDKNTILAIVTAIYEVIEIDDIETSFSIINTNMLCNFIEDSRLKLLSNIEKYADKSLQDAIKDIVYCDAIDNLGTVFYIQHMKNVCKDRINRRVSETTSA